jgi:hypothetical protein
MTANIGPLTAQVQEWWTAQHEQCPSLPIEPEWGQTYMGRQAMGRWCGVIPCGWRGELSADQLALCLRRNLRSGAVQSAQLLEQPDAHVALQVASALAPKPYGNELTLVADIIDAAGAQTNQERNQALVGAGLALIALMVYAGIKNGL